MYMNTRDGLNITLKLIGATGFDGINVTAPNATQGLQQLLNKSSNKGVDYKRVLAELKRQRLVQITKDGGQLRFVVTPAGVYRLQNLMLDEIVIDIPKKWDKRWRVVSFDIPLTHSKDRIAFTQKLRNYNFVMLKKSTWIHPARCFEQIEQLASHYNIMRYCTLLEVRRIDELTTRKLMRHYNTLHS
jgi:DNA-binding transcriptional regulator PaaX